MKIYPSHPRAQSLKIRERLVWGVKRGITSLAGLTAHGRGEAFDYLLGEKTQLFAKKATQTAAAYLLTAKHPVLSVNGNSAVLCAKEYIQIARLLRCNIEVNLFHFTKRRVENVENYLKKLDSKRVLISDRKQKITIPNITSPRKVMLREGIGRADVVFVPLEDGDRCEVLIAKGKKVITVDLNPLSRTAQKATVTIVDNITRVMPLLYEELRSLQQAKQAKLKRIIDHYDNAKTLGKALQHINIKLSSLVK